MLKHGFPYDHGLNLITCLDALPSSCLLCYFIGSFRPFAGHYLGGDLCLPTTFQVVPYQNPLVGNELISSSFDSSTSLRVLYYTLGIHPLGIDPI